MAPVSRPLHRLLGAMAALMLSACAGMPAAPTPATAPDYGEGGWHSCRIGISWPEGEPPDWGVDAYLAHAVIAPVLLPRLPDLAFWRFHRRALRDPAGHLFSLIFYADTGISTDLAEALLAQPSLNQTRAAGVVTYVSCEDVAHWSGPEISATSDRSWSAAMQAAWPHFIMGSSRLWLDLLDAQLADGPPRGPLDGRLARYREANQAVNQIWATEGGHALLHHLNAVFGYVPLHMRY